MVAIVNRILSLEALKTLENYAEPLLFSTSGITYKAIAGHPDIFFCQNNDRLIVAPNTPYIYIEQFLENDIDFSIGFVLVGNQYPQTSHYNAVITDEYVVHNSKYTDKVISEMNTNKKFIDVKQGYTRCNLLPVGDAFITSDRGIEKQLLSENILCLFVNSDDILLPGFKHGFFPGACGVIHNNIIINGNLSYLPDGNEIKEFALQQEYTITELHDGPVMDIGSIIFV